MLKGVQGHDNVCQFLSGSSEAAILYAGGNGFLSCHREGILTDIDAYDASGAPQGHLHGLGSLAATKVDYNLPLNPGKELIPEQNREF
jgi:hypothetical protein